VPPSLVPVAAQVTASKRIVTVTFSLPLVPGPVAPANWYTRYNNLRQECLTPVAIGSTVTYPLGATIADPGPNVVSYSPPPFDVVAASGPVAPAFADFPLTVVP